MNQFISFSVSVNFISFVLFAILNKKYKRYLLQNSSKMSILKAKKKNTPRCSIPPHIKSSLCPCAPYFRAIYLKINKLSVDILPHVCHYPHALNYITIPLWECF